jgi:F-type H+-transporting ATPase subunit alpha
MALLKQPAYNPYPVEEMTVSLWLGTTGRLDRVPTEDVLRFEHEFLDQLRLSHSGILSTIRETLQFSEETEGDLEIAYNSFLDQFETSEGKSVRPGTEATVDPVADDELEQEQIVKQKRG